MTHKLIKDKQTNGIDIQGWTVLSYKTSILNSQEIDAASADLGIPIPEMIFGNNFLSIEHTSGFKLEFKALPALAMVDQSSKSSDLIKVSYAREWFDKRRLVYNQQASNMVNQEHITDVVKPYDWTYTTKYNGTNLSVHEKMQFTPTTTEIIDIEQLRRPDPILFYDENILFEDELADNGTAVLTTKVRVMPSCFLILLRFFLRVDDVLFRIHDTRIYHRFGTNAVVRECSTRESSYKEIRAKIPRSNGEDLSLLLDSNWVSSQLPEQSSWTEAANLEQ
ncbi:TIP41-like family-domain-containing protein [Lobosporangium transversale]|uniref:TIP41-like family-domain-containing protein n=1 Tax=Lobosporangium transversale TaxID=64571 RepID=A0A1Y2GMJ8_9FUNG|nr:TIP41-like family-domain-containing protein [Lobosporangium transversale]ORZ15475.1 TIP41-like family-domain-containing protein [Lobosporangium transversale]|eukprot:XP_021881223.1 TIP41-like family-domain-containing protein [Lobosporangium transversale]